MLKSWAFDKDVSLFLYKEKDGPDLQHDWEKLLPPEEIARAAKMQSRERANTFLYARALLRKKLGQILNLDSASLEIGITAEGKPFVAKPKPLAFSLAHAHGHVLIGLAPNATSLGVDLEYMDPDRDIEKMAMRMISIEERVQLTAAPDREKQKRAYEFWCRYEARKKCGGKNIRTTSGFLEKNFVYAVCCEK